MLNEIIQIGKDKYCVVSHGWNLKNNKLIDMENMRKSVNWFFFGGGLSFDMLIFFKYYYLFFLF